MNCVDSPPPPPPPPPRPAPLLFFSLQLLKAAVKSALRASGLELDTTLGKVAMYLVFVLNCRWHGFIISDLNLRSCLCLRRLPPSLPLLPTGRRCRSQRTPCQRNGLFSCCHGLNSVQFGSVRFSSVRFGSVRFGSVRFGSVRFGSVRFGSVRFGSVQFCSVQFNSVQLGSF